MQRLAVVEQQRLVFCLRKIKVCNPREIRNRRRVSPSQIMYEKCDSDGSGWDTVLENCPSDHSCENGYCVLNKDGWYDTSETRCNLNGVSCGYGIKEVKQEYRDYTCFGVTCTYRIVARRWVEAGSCYRACQSGYFCVNGYCKLLSIVILWMDGTTLKKKNVALNLSVELEKD